MAIGTALLLVAVGAILAYAVDVNVPGVDVQTVGSVLFFVGLLGLAITIGMEMLAQRAHRPRATPVARAPRRERVREPEVAARRPATVRPAAPSAPPPAAAYNPVVGPPGGADGPTRVADPRPRAQPPAPDDGTRPTRVVGRDDER
jgi:hypothetical protein